MVEKKALGKGLKALIGEPEEFARYETSAWDRIPLEEIEPNPHQPRENFDQGKLAELVASIKANGVIQPIILRKVGSKYQIIAGERRWRAAQMADMPTIPAIIRDATEQEMLKIALVENIQRQDLNPIEEAHAYKALTDEFSLTQDALSLYIGKDRSTIANTMRLLGLPQEIQDHVSRGTVSMGHARALLTMGDFSAQLDLCKRVVKEGLSVRQVERLVKSQSRARGTRPMGKDPNVRKVEEELQRRLGTRVKIDMSGKGGKIEIEFYSQAELESLVNRLLGR